MSLSPEQLELEEIVTLAVQRAVASSDDFYLSLPDLAKRSGFSVVSLRRYINDHGLPCYMVSGKIVVNWLDFKEWLNRYRVEHEPMDEIFS